MTSPLTPLELLAKEIGLLQDKRTSMEAAIKASEARLKDIRSVFDLAAIKAKQDLENLELEQAQKMAALNVLVEPLQGQIDALQHQVTKEQKRLQDIEAERLLALDDRRKQMAVLDAALQNKQQTLAALTGEIQSLKDKVGAL